MKKNFMLIVTTVFALLFAVPMTTEAAENGKWVKSESILKNFESELDTLYKLGEHIGNVLSEAMELKEAAGNARREREEALDVAATCVRLLNGEK